MRDIKFMSYDGEYPNLCSGELILLIDGKKVSLGECLSSGGRVSHNEEYEYTVTSGDWGVSFDAVQNLNLTDNEKDLIRDLVNENVPQGCCGGCI